MAVRDDPHKSSPQDAHRVNVHQEHDLQYWSEKWGVCPEHLKQAVEKVGPMADDVVGALGRRTKADA
jgi:Protein of unknown function (DUF3606)